MDRSGQTDRESEESEVVVRMKKVILIVIVAMCGIAAAYLFGYAVASTGQSEVRSELEYIVEYKLLENSDSLIVKESKRTIYYPSIKQWIPRDRISWADSTLADRVLLIFFDSTETWYDTVRYSTK